MYPPPLAKVSKSQWLLKTTELYRGAEHVVEWGDFLPKEKGDKYQREYLLRSCKGLLMALISAPRITRGEGVSSRTVINWFYAIRRLTWWMIERDIYRFSALTAREIVDYIETTFKPGNALKGISYHRSDLRLLQQLWELRSHYTAPLRVDPATLYLSMRSRLRDPVPWKPIDDSISLPLIKDALDWIDSYSEALLEMNSSMWDMARRSVGYRHKEILIRKRMLCASFDANEEFTKIRQLLNLQSESASRVFDKALKLLEGACITVILFLVGLRVGELASLNYGCVEPHEESDGLLGFHLSGISAKSGGREKTWAITEPVKKAIEVLERLHYVSRSKWKQSALILQPRGNGLTSTLSKCVRMETICISKRLLVFATSPFRPVLPEGVRLHPHAARKTFARFVVLRDKTALESLAYHYGHVHRAITDSAYVGGDIELERLLAEESRKDLAKGLTDILTSTHIGGRASKALRKVPESPEDSPHFRGKRSVSQMVEILINKGVQLAPCDWGYCVYSQAFSACHGDDKGPNELERSPDVCAGCSNFTVTEHHRAWWETRYTRERAFLDARQSKDQTFEIARLRFTRTKQVIASLARTDEYASERAKNGYE